VESKGRKGSSEINYSHARVQYKIAMLTFKVFHDSAPRYMESLVAVADLPIKLSTVGSHAYAVAAAQVWNVLPEVVVSSSSLQTYRRQLKSHLFQRSYSHLISWPFDWHRYSGPCSTVRYIGHSNNLYLLTYLHFLLNFPSTPLTVPAVPGLLLLFEL